MKRAGFTMIELIFVIVIIGILSAVALPKFIGVASQAHLAKVKSYVGTFNMTTGPALWSEAISDGNGSINWMGDSNLTDQLATPAELTTFNGLSACQQGIALPDVNTTTSVALTGSNIFAETVQNGKTYVVGCVDGNASSSPRLWIQIGNAAGKQVIQN